MKAITKCIFLVIILITFNAGIADTAFEVNTTGEYVQQSTGIDTTSEVAVVPAGVEDIRNAMFIVGGLVIFLMLVTVLIATQFTGP